MRNGSFNVILVEADGAARRSAKGYAPHEPNIPAASDVVIVVTGLDLLGGELTSRWVHRAALAAQQIGRPEGSYLDEEALAKLNGLGAQMARRQAFQARRIAFLNKADALKTVEKGKDIARHLLDSGLVERVLIGSCISAEPVAAFASVINPGGSNMIAAIVLAAGSSKRMGEHKLLIRLGEKTVIEHAVDNILASAVDKVVVVTGYNAPPVRKVLAERGRETALKSGRLKVIHNPHYEEGQATSVRAGLAELNEHVQAILFCLGDQPLSPDTINTLVRTFREKKPLVVYPNIAGAGNPVLFQQKCVPGSCLKGDEGDVHY